MINYSLTLRNITPGKPGEKKVYATAQAAATMNLRQFAKHIASHGSTFDKGTIEGVMSQAVQCMREMLLAGYNLQLGDLGNFRIGITSKGAKTVEEFNPATNIKRIYVRWTPGADFQNLAEDVEWQYVTTKEEQAEARKAAKDALAAELGESGDGSEENGGGNVNGE